MFAENGVTKWEIDFPAAFPSLSMYARFEQHSGGRAVLVEELDVHRLIPEPGTVLQSGSAHAHHTDRVAVIPQKIGVGLDEAGGQDTCGVDHNRPDHGGLHQSDGRHVGQTHVGRLVPVQRVVDVHPRRTGYVQGNGGRTVSRGLAHGGHRGITVVQESGRAGIGRIRSGKGADLPAARSIQIPRPAVVLLILADVGSIGVALHDRARGVRQHDRLLLALVNAEVRIEVSAGIEVSGLRLTTADDGEEPVGRHDGARRDLEFDGIVDVVRQVPSTDVHGRARLVEQLHEVLVVARDVQGVVRTRELIDDDLRTQGHQGQPRQGQEKEQVPIQIQGSAMYGE